MLEDKLQRESEKELTIEWSEEELWLFLVLTAKNV